MILIPLSVALLTTITLNSCDAQNRASKLNTHYIIAKSPKDKTAILIPDVPKQDLMLTENVSDIHWILSQKNSPLVKKAPTTFVEDRNGRTYKATKNGILMSGSLTSMLITDDSANIPENNITALELDNQGHLWIGTYKSGVVLGIGRSIIPFKIKAIITHENNVFSIFVDQKGFVWVVYRNGGLECFQNDVSVAYFPKKIV